MLRVERITKKMKNFKEVVDLYQASFPKEEQAPIHFILHRGNKSHTAFNAYYDHELFVGLSCTTIYEDITYVIWLAVHPEVHAKGYGSQILNAIKESKPSNRIVLNIEIEDEENENQGQRARRRRFYERNDFSSTKIIMEFRGIKMEMLSFNGVVTEEAFFRVHKQFLGSILSLFLLPKVLKNEVDV